MIRNLPGLDTYRTRRLTELLGVARVTATAEAISREAKDPSLPEKYWRAVYVSWFGQRPARADAGSVRGPQPWRYERVCWECDQPFPTSRPDARTCSDRCRQRLHRWWRRYQREHPEVCSDSSVTGAPCP